MRVIAKEVCFVAGSRRRVGEEFEYTGAMPNGQLPKYLVPADPAQRKAMADVKRVQAAKDQDAVKAAAGPKRKENPFAEANPGKVHTHWPTTQQEKDVALGMGVKLEDPPAPEGTDLL